MGLLSFHDAAENALGAVADELHAKVQNNAYLIQYYDWIQQADSLKRSLPYRTQMGKLNTIRNGIKHQGILPNPSTDAHYPVIIREFVVHVCREYFDLDFELLSLKDSIRNPDVRVLVGQVEQHIEAEQYREGLEVMSRIMFDIFESSILGSQQMEKRMALRRLHVEQGPQPDVVFPEFNHLTHTIVLLEKGIEPFLYHRFKNLTPKIGKSEKTGDVVLEWDKFYGHPGNWTEENARFCYDFILNAVLKFQGEEYRGYELISYFDLYVDYIEAVAEEAVFWDRVGARTDMFGLQKPLAPPKQVLKLRRGQRIVGFADTLDANRQYYFVRSKDIPSDDLFGGFGCVKKDEVRVTPFVPREAVEPSPEKPGAAATT